MTFKNHVEQGTHPYGVHLLPREGMGRGCGCGCAAQRNGSRCRSSAHCRTPDALCRTPCRTPPGHRSTRARGCTAARWCACRALIPYGTPALPAPVEWHPNSSSLVTLCCRNQLAVVQLAMCRTPPGHGVRGRRVPRQAGVPPRVPLQAAIHIAVHAQRQVGTVHLSPLASMP